MPKADKDGVQKLASLTIFELRVFRSKNSVLLLYTAIRGGNDAVQKLASLPIFGLRVCIKTVHPARF